MDAVQEILASIPFDRLAAQVGTDPATAERMAGQLVPALIGGMSANADDHAGARSLANALNDHAGSSLIEGGVDLDRVDTADGDAIVHNVFGAQTPQVTQRLGSQLAGGNSELVQKLLRYLAPIVLAYLARKLTEGRGGAGGGSILGDILGGLLGGGSHEQQGQQRSPDLPDILRDMLGGVLGGGGARQAPAPRQQPDARQPDFTPPAPRTPSAPPAPQGGEAPAPDQIPLDSPAPADPAAPPGDSGGGLLDDLLGGLLGGGRRS